MSRVLDSSRPGAQQLENDARHRVRDAPYGVTSIDPPGTFEVIGAGFGRTGTLSLKVALDELGLPCYHMSEVFKHKGHAQLWLEAAKGGDVDIRQLLSGYKATTDFPTVHFYKQLMELYPDAKVILTERDPAKWYNSLKQSVNRGRQAITRMPWYVAILLGFGPMREAGPMIDQLCYQMDMQCTLETFADEETAKKVQQVFLQHNEEVKKVVPADRLLVYDISQGWEPLCAFLGKPIPNKPFPHVNDAAGWKKRLDRMEPLAAALTYIIPAAAVALLAGGIMIVSRWLQQV